MISVLLMMLAAQPGGRSAAPQSLPSLTATRLAILAAEDRRAPDARDLATIRAGAHSEDAETVRIAVRALGRLERPELIADILPGLRIDCLKYAPSPPMPLPRRLKAGPTSRCRKRRRASTSARQPPRSRPG